MTAPLHSPDADGAAAVFPQGQALAHLIETACQCCGDMPFEVAGLPAAELRRQCRAEVAAGAGLDVQGLWVVAAHQAELAHAGVWFKDVAAVALAQVLEAQVLHVVADLDVLKHVALELPHVEERGPRAWIEAAVLVAPVALQCPAQLVPPASQKLEQATAWARQRISWESLFETWAAAGRAATSTASTLAQWFKIAQQAVSQEMGVTLPLVFLSRLCRGPCFARFAADMILRYRQMHRAHAEALSEYRSAAHEKNPAQPVPDLKHQDGAWELPLWAYCGKAARQPLYVLPDGQRLRLQTPAGVLTELPAEDNDATVSGLLELAARDIVLAPRALPLTMFLRTFVAEVFIHGTGGSRYDEVTDALVRRWWNWSPPPYITATATVRLPLAALPVKREDLAGARWHAHHAWHNPPLYSQAGELSPEIDALMRRRSHLLEQLRQLPRFSPARAAAFTELHEVNAELRKGLAATVARADAHVEQIRRQLAYNAVVQSREYFFALMSRAKLEGLVQQARQWAAAGRAELTPCAGAHGCDQPAIKRGKRRPKANRRAETG